VSMIYPSRSALRPPLPDSRPVSASTAASPAPSFVTPDSTSALYDHTVTPMEVMPGFRSPLKSNPAGTDFTAIMGQTLAERHLRLTQLEQRMMHCLYNSEPVTDCQLLDHMVRRNLNFDEFPELVQLSDLELAHHLSASRGVLAKRLLRSLPHRTVARLVTVPAIAELALRHSPYFFDRIPEEMKTPEVLAPLLESLSDTRRRDLLMWISIHEPDLQQHLETMEQGIRSNSYTTCRTRAAELTPALRRLAVTIDYTTISLFQSVPTQEYGALCDLALEQSGKALELIADDWRTEARIDRALAHSTPPPIQAIPEHLYTSARLTAALYGQDNAELASEFLRHWHLWDALKTHPDWLCLIAAHERTEALCREYLSRFPGNLSPIPTAILAANRQWQQACQDPAVYLPLRQHTRVATCYGMHKSHQESPPPETQTQLWVLALASWRSQARNLPQDCKKRILANGGSGGLDAMFQPPLLCLHPEALLDPIQEEHCSRRAAALPDQARIRLLCAQSLPLRRQLEGLELIRQIDEQFLTLSKQLQDNSLARWKPEAGDIWTRKGGRTLVHTGQNGCVHMKFHRREEPLDRFVAEQAAQTFALAHPGFGWRSQIPQPEGICLVPTAALPVPAASFADALTIHNHAGHKYYLAFRFTTRDDSYDTPAWQPDRHNGCQAAHKGLLNALHDIGIWSSLGAVHTSTIQLYHHFDGSADTRAELLLNAFFHPTAIYPGTLHYWDTKAMEPSDWGWSGLRDLGDLEFYPFITSYIESSDAHWTLPDYAQRASFVNAIAHNILGSLLHYMRLHRDTDPDYHYKNARSVRKLEQFIEQACDTLLAGLLGNGTRLEDLFPQDPQGVKDIFAEWLYLTAREMIYWTARQEPGTDCFAEHLNTSGRPSAALYPGHPWQNIRYGTDYTEPEGESLGSENGKLPLFYLVRGLYLLAIGLVNQAEQPQAMAS